MAVIGKIREKSTLLLIIIGGALVAFVIGTDLSSGGSVFNQEASYVGVIDGHPVKGSDYNARIELEIENYKNRENRVDVPEFIRGQISQQVWNQYLNELVMGKQLEVLGLAVTTEELADMTYGDDPHPMVKRNFTNPQTGVFNPADVINFLKNLENDNAAAAKKQWLVFEKAIKQERIENKYKGMIQKGLYVTKSEAKADYEMKNVKLDISYIAKNYNTVPDSAVNVTEADIRAYYDAHQSDYEEERMRNISYVIFPVYPSADDSAKVKAWVDETFEEFKMTESDDSFVNLNSDVEFDGKYYSEGALKRGLDTAYFDIDSIGYTDGPILEDGIYKMIKIADIKFAPDSVHARHVMISTQSRAPEAAKALADSLKQAIDGGEDLGQMALLYSDDQGTKEGAGDLGWFEEGYMIPVINDSCFNPNGSQIMMVESSFGFHIMEVLERSEVVKKMQFAIVERSIDASRETYDKAFVEANSFAVNLKGQPENVEELAQEAGKMKQDASLRDNDNSVPGLESSRGLVRWAFNADEGKVSDALEYGGTFVVAVMTEAREDGVAPFERVKIQAEQGAIKEKKAEQFISEMQGITDLDQGATQTETTVRTAQGVTFGSYTVSGMGRELDVMGKIFAMNQGDLSIPIKGDNGVYIVRIDQKTDAAVIEDYSNNAAQVEQQWVSRVNYEVFEALKSRVEIEDSRYKFE